MGSNTLGFKDWALGEGLCFSSAIDQLKDTRLGIDANDYVYSLLYGDQQVSRQKEANAQDASQPDGTQQDSCQREPLLSALGGLPLSLHKRVSEHVRNFRAAGIEPVFVFDGLDLACKDRASIFREARKAESTLKSAWSIYDEGRAQESVTAFGKLSLYRSEHIIRAVRFYLHSLGVHTQTAPYSAAAQLVYMQKQHFVDSICGSASCLVFGSERVIIDIDWKRMKFNWLSMTKCQSKLAIGRDHFVTVCLLSGSSILHAYPEIDNEQSTSKIQAARGLLTRAGYDANNLFPDPKDHGYRELFQKAQFALKHPVVITSDGQVQPLSWESGPNDAHDFIGRKLPEELYAYLTFGLAGPRVLNWRTRMEIVETPPLDGGDSEAYKKLVQEKLRPLRAQALALITPPLHRWYQKQDVSLVGWWNESNETPLNLENVVESSTSGSSWHVKSQAFPQQQNALSTPLSYAITSLSSDAEAKKTVTPRTASDGAILQDPAELRANAVWRFLENRGYISSDHTLSTSGRALKVSFEHAAKSGLLEEGLAQTEIEEALFMAFELIRLDTLNSKTLFPLPPYTGAPMRGSEEDRAHTLLVSRIACLAKFHHAEIGYTGPLSRHLLAYHQMAAAVRGALRDLVEMHACNMFLSGAVDRNVKTSVYRELGDNLPFLIEPDIGLALVVKSYLDEQSRPATERTDITRWFGYASDIPGDLEKAWKLWDAVNAGVQAADAKVISADTKKMFKETNEWLSHKRDTSIIPNGTA